MPRPDRSTFIYLVINVLYYSNSKEKSSETTQSWLTPRCLLRGVLNHSLKNVLGEDAVDIYGVLSEDIKLGVRCLTPRKIVGLTTITSSPRTFFKIPTWCINP